MRSAIAVHHAPLRLPAEWPAEQLSRRRCIREAAERALRRVAGLTAVGRVHARVVGGDPSEPFCRRALEALGVSLVVESGDIGRTPASGPLVVVANHPFGAVDGLALIDLIGRVRSDVKILANRVLRALPGLSPHLIAVDAFGGPQAHARNVAALREAAAWLAAGGCLCVFPAGEVAHTEADGRVIDSAWHASAAELAVRAGAPVLPVHFEGQNSRLFRLAGRVHPFLRTVLLPREMWRRRASAVAVRIGDVVPSTTLLERSTPRARTQWLRSMVDGLALRRPYLPVAARVSAALIDADVAALEGTALVESGSFAVYCAPAGALPAVLPEIGRLREVAFRAVGEGTGRARDLDRFDETYLHLFVWDRDAHQIAGAYRLRATDRLAAEGVGGLYTRTLFEYDQTLLTHMGPSLELGRSFVAPAYQRDYSPLLLLWKGIGRVVASAPRYRRLFGAVSISDRYRSTTRELLASFLTATCGDATLAALVHPAHPLPSTADLAAHVSSGTGVEALSALVRQREGDGKDIPVLLRQYLRLSAKILAFSVDRAFGDVLDGLFVVDLAGVERPLLNRYLGRSEAERFLSVHAAR